MSDTPRACPNMGIDCEFPDCTFLDADCAKANAEPVKSREELQSQADALGGDPAYIVEQDRHRERTLFPITADDIFGKKG